MNVLATVLSAFFNAEDQDNVTICAWVRNVVFCETSGSHDGEYDDETLLG
jgi:hypothetical protein